MVILEAWRNVKLLSNAFISTDSLWIVSCPEVLFWCPQHETITESSASFLHILLSLVSFLFSYTSLLTNTVLDQTRNFIFTRLLFCKDAYVRVDICCLWSKNAEFFHFIGLKPPSRNPQATLRAKQCSARGVKGPDKNNVTTAKHGESFAAREKRDLFLRAD